MADWRRAWPVTAPQMGSSYTRSKAISDTCGHLLEMSHSAQWGWNTMLLLLSWQHTASTAHACNASHRWLTVKACGRGMKHSRTRKLLWHQVVMKRGWMIVSDLCRMAAESCSRRTCRVMRYQLPDLTHDSHKTVIQLHQGLVEAVLKRWCDFMTIYEVQIRLTQKTDDRSPHLDVKKYAMVNKTCKSIWLRNRSEKLI